MGGSYGRYRCKRFAAMHRHAVISTLGDQLSLQLVVVFLAIPSATPWPGSVYLIM